MSADMSVGIVMVALDLRDLKADLNRQLAEIMDEAEAAANGTGVPSRRDIEVMFQTKELIAQIKMVDKIGGIIKNRLVS